MKEIHWSSLIGCMLVILVIGSLSGLANAGSITGWYATLKKPFFNPPGYVFGPVWTVLYLLMGISLYLMLQAPKSEIRTLAIIIFSVQMILNFMWSFLFFYFKLPLVAFIDIILLWAAIVMMILVFYRISPLTAYLQLPYLVWVSFASVLNGCIWYLNR